MSGSYWYKWFLVGTFLAIIGSVGIVQATIEIREGDPPQVLELFERAPAVPHLRAFETRLENASWFDGQLRPLAAYWRYELLGDTGAKAIQGFDDWWFYRDGVRYLFQPVLRRSEDRQGLECALEAITHVRDELREMDIDLLVVPVPGKASIYPDKLTNRLDAPLVNGPTRSLINALRDADVNVVDLFETFARARAESPDDLLFLPRDTHWTPHGLKIAAKEVAHRIRSHTGEVEYTLNTAKVERPHDIVDMLEVKRIEDSCETATIRCEQVISQADSRPFTSTRDAPILVLGDSFCVIYEQNEPKHAGFIAHLAYELRQPITYLINEGGASTMVRQELARRNYLLNGKRLVIWEFVERDVRYGKLGWQRFRLTPTKEPDTQTGDRSKDGSQ